MTNNVETDTLEIYWRRFVFVPFLDHLLQEFDTRFSAITRKAILGLKFLPNNVASYANITDLHECYSRDLPPPASMSAEVRLGKKKWHSSEETRTYNLQETMSATSNSMFPNLFRMFHLLMLLSVTSAGADRTHSTLKLVETVTQSTRRQERLSALVLLRVHKDIKLDIKAIIDQFSRKHPKNVMFFLILRVLIELLLIGA